MGKSLVHVGIPYQAKAACGAAHMGINGAYREKITCKNCRKTEWFKQLPNWPKDPHHDQ